MHALNIQDRVWNNELIHGARQAYIQANNMKKRWRERRKVKYKPGSIGKLLQTTEMCSWDYNATESY